jgi:hypothetical protein
MILQHLKDNWPLALVVLMLLVYTPITLISGRFYTNQGSIARATQPVLYWRWVRRMLVLSILSAAALIGSYYLRRGR